MTAAFEGLGFGDAEPAMVNDLPEALLAGVETLLAAAVEHGLPEETVAVIFEAAFNPFCGFTPTQVEGYSEIVELSLAIRGLEWTDACLAAPERRSAAFLAVRKQCIRWAAKHFPALHEHDRLAVVEDLLYIELAGSWIHSTAAGGKLPGWMIPGIVFERLQWRLLDAKKKLVDREREVTVRRGDSETTYGIQSLDKFIEDLGERPAFVRPMWDVPVDDAGVEAVVWSAARVNLADRVATMVENARAGSAREKVTLTVEAAKWVLAQGSEDSVRQHGAPVSGSAEEFRQKYAQDSLLACFQGLRAAAPTSWGAYPETAVPVRDVIERVATEAQRRSDRNASWFARLEARRVEVAKSDRLLHGVRRLVESLIKEAAHETDE